MKLGIKCRVDSHTVIGKEPVRVSTNELDFILRASEEGLLNELAIITDMNPQERFLSELTPSSLDPQSWYAKINSNGQAYGTLKNATQYIEAVLSFQWGVEKIHLEDGEFFLIPETEEERKSIDILNFSFHMEGYPVKSESLSVETFKGIVLQRSKYEPFKVLLFFYKEGVQEFRLFRYVQAFYNFYFVLEDLYAQGKVNNLEVEKRFKASQVLRGTIQQSLVTHMQGYHLQNILGFLREEKKIFDADGIIELIVQVRGNLHHFSRKSTKRKGTPLNQGEFESIALLLMGVSFYSLRETMFE